MEDIIKQLSHIEEKAVGIMKAADQQKKEIAYEMEQKTKELDRQIAADTKKRLQKMQEQLNMQKNEELKKLEAANLESQTILNQKFQQNHTKWANELLQELIGA